MGAQASALLAALEARDPATGRHHVSQFVRVRAANRPWPPRQEWLIAEWPEHAEQPTDYWLSNLPPDTEPERLARLARLRWKIELDYKQLKGELGLDHYEGRSRLGWHAPASRAAAAAGRAPWRSSRPHPPRSSPPACERYGGSHSSGWSRWRTLPSC